MSQSEGRRAEILINKQAPHHNASMHFELIIARAYNSYHKCVGGGSDALIVIDSLSLILTSKKKV